MKRYYFFKFDHFFMIYFFITLLFYSFLMLRIYEKDYVVAFSYMVYMLPVIDYILMGNLKRFDLNNIE